MTIANVTTDAVAACAALAKAVGDPARARILMALARGELCACHLAGLLELDPSTISRHMGVLRAAGLVATRKDGRWVHYRRAGTDAPTAVRQTLRWLDDQLDGSPAIAADRERLAGCTACAPERGAS